MFKVKDKRAAREKVKYRIRRRLRGNEKRPRLAVYRSLKHIYAQAVDDSTGRTLASVSTMNSEIRSGAKYGGNVAAAKLVGEKIAKKLMEAGLKEVVFDRSGYIYHGRIQALADAAREKGLRF